MDLLQLAPEDAEVSKEQILLIAGVNFKAYLQCFKYDIVILLCKIQVSWPLNRQFRKFLPFSQLKLCFGPTIGESIMNMTLNSRFNR